MLRNYCFTINNYTEEDKTLALSSPYQYIILGDEVGESGTPHIQGYIEFKNPIRFNTVKKYFPRAHLEARRGTQDEAIEYCKKDGKYTEHGTPKQQGHRSDLDKCRQLALTEGMRGVSALGNAQGIRVAEKFLTYHEEPRNWKPLVIWLWGPTGTGKSRLARSLLEDRDIYTKNTGHKWWDGYDQHDSVIIDDFRPSWWDLTYMLALLDRYEFQVEYKGGLRQFVPKTIVITSCMPPHECYKGTGEAIQQLVRRIDIVDNIVTDVTEVGEGNTSASPPVTTAPALRCSALGAPPCGVAPSACAPRAAFADIPFYSQKMGNPQNDRVNINSEIALTAQNIPHNTSEVLEL